MIMQKLESERFTIKFLERGDRGFYSGLYLDKNLMQLVGDYSCRDKIEVSFENCLRYNEQTNFRRLTYCIYRDDKRIGITSLIRSRQNSEHAEIGTIVVSNMQTKKVAYEVMKVLINYALSSLGITRIYSNYSSKNIAAMKLVQNLNFTIQPLENDMCHCFQESFIP